MEFQCSADEELILGKPGVRGRLGLDWEVFTQHYEQVSHNEGIHFRVFDQKQAQTLWEATI